MSSPRPTYAMSTDLVRGLLAAEAGGAPLAGIFGAYLIEWDAVTFANRVSIGAQSWVNLRFLNPTLLSIGPVLMVATPASPIILGRLGEPTV